MIIARILGTVVSTQKDERLQGKKLLIVRPINVDGSDTTGYVVAVDTVGAGDAFAAGYLASWLWGHGPLERLPPANAVGALCAMSYGDYEGLPTRPELEAFMEGAREPER